MRPSLRSEAIQSEILEAIARVTGLKTSQSFECSFLPRMVDIRGEGSRNCGRAGRPRVMALGNLSWCGKLSPLAQQRSPISHTIRDRTEFGAKAAKRAIFHSPELSLMPRRYKGWKNWTIALRKRMYQDRCPETTV